MQQTGFGILRISEWILKFAYLNLLFIVFSFLGCLGLGIFPASASMLTVIRKWLMGHTDIPIFSTFWISYKKDFLRSNLLGYILIFIGSTLFMYYLFLNQVPDGLAVWLRYPLFMLMFIYILFLLYVFPVFVHYELKVIHVLRTALFIMGVSPLSTVMMLAGGILIYFLLLNFPGLLPLFGGSLIGFVIMWSSYLGFLSLKQKEEKAAAAN